MCDFINPECPDCGKQLAKEIGNMQRPTYPPQRRFQCENCEFSGFVTMKLP